MSNALYVAWRFGSAEKGAWAPVGLLERVEGLYRFRYTRGALAGSFVPFPSMPEFHEVYESVELFPIFSNRLLARSRPEYEAYLAWSGFEPGSQPDPISILGVTEGIRQTDQFEVFPRPARDDRNRYHTRFFLHGLRWIPAEALDHLSQLAPGTSLAPMPEPSNPHDQHAVAVRTAELQNRFPIGYIPRYLAPDVVELLNRCERCDVRLTVARVNERAPLQMRLLCSLDACWPVGFEPCGGEDFQPLITVAHANLRRHA